MPEKHLLPSCLLSESTSPQIVDGRETTISVILFSVFIAPLTPDLLSQEQSSVSKVLIGLPWFTQINISPDIFYNCLFFLTILCFVFIRLSPFDFCVHGTAEKELNAYLVLTLNMKTE